MQSVTALSGCLLATSIALGVSLSGCSHPKLDTDQLEREYLAQEGHDARGPAFAALVLSFDSPLMNRGTEPHINLTQGEVVKLLGDPDLQKKKGESTELIHFYDRFGDNDWFVAVSFASPEDYAEFGYNAATELDVTEYEEYSK